MQQPDTAPEDGVVPVAPTATSTSAAPAEATTTDDAIPEDLLGAETAPPTPVTTRPTPPPNANGVSGDEKLKRYYNELYRPESNPAMMRVAVHGLFLAASGKELGGRMGGVQAEFGQSWNRVGYGIGLAGYGGNTLVGRKQYSQSWGMLGGGPTVSLGRTGLMRNGYIDLTAGYDFFYMPAEDSRFAISDGERGESFFVPHGPRVRLDLGLIGLARRNQNLRHGMGISIGWQAFISSLAGGQHGYSNVLMVGMSYMAQ